MIHLNAATQRATASRLAAAVHRNRIFSREGVLERIFTLSLRGLVYPQIWEDPAIDLEALQIRPTDHVLAIGSGGCNILNYLVADPARISAIDLNGAHVALIRLKLCALRHLPEDWMTGSDLSLLWTEITRTARPQARVIFRTAAEKNLLFGRVPSEILARWRYDEDYCRELTRRDRSSIYGGFHLHSLRNDS